MAMTADSSSPRDGLKSPQFRRKNFSQVVRSASESTPAVHHSTSSPLLTTSPPSASQPEQTNFSDCSPSKEPSLSSPPPDISLATDGDSGSNSYSNAAALSKKQAWNVPPNDVGEVGRVMEVAAWPALSESARASTKSLSESSSKTVPDGSPSTSQAPVISQSTQMKGTGYASSNATPTRPMSGRQRSSKRGGEGNSSGSALPQGGFQHQHPPPPPPLPLPPFPVVNMPVYGYGNFIPTMDPSMGDPQYRGNNWEPRPVGGFASQLHSNPRPSRRGGNYGQRGDGGYHNNFRGRHDQDRGSYGNTRDGHMHPQRAPPRGYPRPPAPNADAFMPPQPVMSFVNPLGYPDMIYYPTMPMEPFRGMPLFAPVPPSPMLMPVQEPSLSTLLLNQIDYYFSDANLVKDEFLKSNMDDQGWVSISLIAGFPRVKSLTDNIQLILDSLQSSTVVEVLDNRVRRRNDWINWIPSRVSKNFGLPSTGGSSSDMLASSFQQITVTEESSGRGEAGNVNSLADDTPGGHASELTGCTQLSSGEGSKDVCLDKN